MSPVALLRAVASGDHVRGDRLPRRVVAAGDGERRGVGLNLANRLDGRPRVVDACARGGHVTADPIEVAGDDGFGEPRSRIGPRHATAPMEPATGTSAPARNVWVNPSPVLPPWPRLSPTAFTPRPTRPSPHLHPPPHPT